MKARTLCRLASMLVILHGAVSAPMAVAQGFAPDEAVGRMTLADGFEASLVASEPLVRQPVCIEFDDRGRLWVIQYLQYPNPEGLTRVSVDRYSRTEYDRVPEPPPHGPRGADRITILEDIDGDGRMDGGKDFIDGLNLASGMAFGDDGVYVLNVPYLLFYPDKDRDDVPDGDPQVLLTGFGMQDAHSVANSLTFGPDGWLYGCQGSTVTADIRGIEFQQGVWRYHPATDRFELFCEGGGNAWGLDFDRVGNLLYSTNYGGFVLVHGVQGGYFVKSFAKHGALHNPFTYGYFDHAPHANFTGGHVTVGGLVYQGDSFPDAYRNKYIAGDLLGHTVNWHEIHPRGSTFSTAHGGKLMDANDTWFAPTDVTMGPDGAIYVADWSDARTAHPDPDADWDRSNGRIYRIAARGTQRAEPTDFRTLSVDELLDLHNHKSQWYVRHARQELARRDEQSVVPRLRKLLASSDDEIGAVESLWTLMTLGGIDEALATTLLDSPHAAVRYWTLRWIGDPAEEVSEHLAHRLDEFAEQEPDVWVRQQLACTAARLPAHQAIPMVNANINRDVDNDDPYLPLLWWWAVERHSVDGREEVLKRFVRPTLWDSQLGSEFLLPRLIRRYAAEGTAAGLDTVMRLLEAAPDDAKRDSLWESILLGLQERGVGGESHQPSAIGQPLGDLILAEWTRQPDNLTLLKLALLMGDLEPLEAALGSAMSPETDDARRVQLLDTLSLAAGAELTGPLLQLVESDAAEPVRSAALRTLARIDDAAIAETLIAVHRASESEALRSQIRDVLLGRRASALAWLSAVDEGEIAANETPIEQIRRVALLNDPALDELVLKHWGKLEGATKEEKLAEVRRLNNDVRAAPGNPAVGRAVFVKRCAACHQLFGEGKKVGPDLTTANRQDREALLVSLVDPSGVVRKEYVSLVVVTKDGRVLTGLPIGRNDSGLTLVDSKGEPTTIATGDIDEIGESTVSLMPDDLYRQLTPQELRDLFAWLQSAGPAK